MHALRGTVTSLSMCYSCVIFNMYWQITTHLTAKIQTNYISKGHAFISVVHWQFNHLEVQSKCNLSDFARLALVPISCHSKLFVLGFWRFLTENSCLPQKSTTNDKTVKLCSGQLNSELEFQMKPSKAKGSCRFRGYFSVGLPQEACLSHCLHNVFILDALSRSLLALMVHLYQH